MHRERYRKSYLTELRPLEAELEIAFTGVVWLSFGSFCGGSFTGDSLGRLCNVPVETGDPRARFDGTKELDTFAVGMDTLAVGVSKVVGICGSLG